MHTVVDDSYLRGQHRLVVSGVAVLDEDAFASPRRSLSKL